MVGKLTKKQLSLRKSLKQAARIKTWQLILILIPLLFITATLLRFDHIKMTELKTAVLEADAAGNDEETSKALEELKTYTFSHIIINVVEKNGSEKITFGTGPFYLENGYLRKTAAVLEEAEKNASDQNPNGNVYAAAMSVCQPQAQRNGWAWNNPDYINCYMTEINKYPATERIEDTVAVSLPSTELYRYNFASPLWAPTPAGFMLLLCAFLILLILVKFIIWLFIRLAIVFVR